jgi:HPt (histidine-containing phosphotransfer) domain-containing protein
VTEPKKPAPANWDINELLERLDGDQEFLRELLRIFCEDSAVNLQKARDALQTQDMPELTRSAHTMKGMLKNLSMNAAGEIAYALELAAREEKIEQAAAYLEQLEAAVAELLPAVNAQLAGVGA